LNNLDRNLNIEKQARNRMEEYDYTIGKTSKRRCYEIAETLLGDTNKGKKVYDTQRDLEKMRERRFGD